MPHHVRIAAWGSAAVLAFDLAMSLASRQFGIPYVWGLVGSTAIYVTLGAFTVRRHVARFPVMKAMAVGAFVGLVDATLGWAISWYIGPGRPETPLTLFVWSWTALFVMLFAAGFTSLGAAVGRRLRASTSGES